MRRAARDALLERGAKASAPVLAAQLVADRLTLHRDEWWLEREISFIHDLPAEEGFSSASTLELEEKGVEPGLIGRLPSAASREAVVSAGRLSGSCRLRVKRPVRSTVSRSSRPRV